ncbi:uncharacterized protein LOC110099637 [Dendrobium catenatum]|uniref:uncharacterized protein LOC110099637 n=1 Tax=Dendrobium catenatum TaxID=906689 RepID=UPI0009F699BD|nr:uncharacterized protein LOC110099637 [Dendrobium catenatum]
MPTIRLLLRLALHRKWNILQLDISNAFLHGDLTEDIYMKTTAGIYRSQPPNRGNNHKEIQSLLQELNSTFALKQLGHANLFLGIQVQTHSQGLFLTQAHYAATLLKSVGMTECKSASTPMDSTSSSKHNTSQSFSDPSLYRRLAGSLQYLSITRPDIAFATNKVCQHMQTPTVQHYKELKRILCYINGTLSFGLPIVTGDLHIHSYTDADWASDNTDRKSTSGFYNFIGPNLISWTVKKQVTVEKSSTEAEYRSLSADISEVIWLRRLAAELQIEQKTPTSVYCDNISAIVIAKNPVFHARTKHIEIDYQFIRQHIASGDIQIQNIPSQHQIADILTKPLSVSRFNELRHKLTIQSNECFT